MLLPVSKRPQLMEKRPPKKRQNIKTTTILISYHLYTGCGNPKTQTPVFSSNWQRLLLLHAVSSSNNSAQTIQSALTLVGAHLSQFAVMVAPITEMSKSKTSHMPQMRTL